MERDTLYYVLQAQQENTALENYAVEREATKDLINLLNAKMPVIITGIRRCGKSFLIKILKNKIALSEKEALYINFNDERLVNFSVEDFQKIEDYMIETSYEPGCFLFLDEIQETPKWEKWIDRIREKYKIIITGSNSKLLSSEIATILTGRTLKLSLFPFSFKEYLNAKKIEINNWKYDLHKHSIIRKNFNEYLKNGGIPKKVLYGLKEILSELYEDIIYKDIIPKIGKENITEIKELGNYFLSNPSAYFTSRSLSEIIKIKNLGTLKRILDAFQNSFLFFYISKFDNSVKKQIRNPKKVYCMDNGLTSQLGFKISEDLGKLLENLIAIELKRRKKEIYYYADKNECDFVIKDRIKITEAIQVCFEINDSNKEREIKGLIAALEKFNLKKGMIITNSKEEKFKEKGKEIEIIPAWKWLLDHAHFD